MGLQLQGNHQGAGTKVHLVAHRELPVQEEPCVFINKASCCGDLQGGLHIRSNFFCQYAVRCTCTASLELEGKA